MSTETTLVTRAQGRGTIEHLVRSGWPFYALFTLRDTFNQRKPDLNQSSEHYSEMAVPSGSLEKVLLVYSSVGFCLFKHSTLQIYRVHTHSLSS